MRHHWDSYCRKDYQQSSQLDHQASLLDHQASLLDRQASQLDRQAALSRWGYRQELHLQRVPEQCCKHRWSIRYCPPPHLHQVPHRDLGQPPNQPVR